MLPAWPDSISAATRETGAATSGAAFETADTMRGAEERLLRIAVRTTVTATASRSSLAACVTNSAAFAGNSGTGTEFTLFLIAFNCASVTAKAEGAAKIAASATANICRFIGFCSPTKTRRAPQAHTDSCREQSSPASNLPTVNNHFLDVSELL